MAVERSGFRAAFFMPGVTFLCWYDVFRAKKCLFRIFLDKHFLWNHFAFVISIQSVAKMQRIVGFYGYLKQRAFLTKVLAIYPGGSVSLSGLQMHASL